MPYTNIAVALACKPDEQPVIDEAVRLSQALGTSLTVLHVNDPLDGNISMMMDTTGPEESEGDLRKQLRQAGYAELAGTVDVRILTGEDFAEAIAEATRDVDLLVVGHRKMGWLRSKMTDSVDENIANLVACPVLIVDKRSVEE